MQQHEKKAGWLQLYKENLLLITLTAPRTISPIAKDLATIFIV